MPHRISERMFEYMPEGNVRINMPCALPDGMSESMSNSVSIRGSLAESIFSMDGRC